jgi:hypothetical protein
MVRVIPIVTAALLVSSVGCIYVTGVQDYKVDDNATSGGPPPDDAACTTRDTFAACETCCSAHHPAEKKATADQLQACACGSPAPCNTPDTCHNDFCQNDLGFFTTACDNCLKQSINNGTCPIDPGNAYNVCVGGCPP